MAKSVRRVFLAAALARAVAGVGIRIALYGGDGAILGDEDYPYQKTIEQAAAALGESSVTVLLEEGVRLNLTRDAFDVVFFPGGSGSRQAKGLGAEGLAAVQAFVSGGGGYIGTCAGAFLGMTSLNLYGADLKLQSLGTGQVQMELTEQGFQDFALDRETFAGNVTIFYQGGPVVAAESLPVDVGILAWYRSALPSWLPTPQGVNTPAVTSSTYGEGRVVLNSPHAEHTQSGGIGPAFYQGELAWILRREAPPSYVV